MKIIDFAELNNTQQTQAAQMLTDELPLGWATLGDAFEEIMELLDKQDEPCYLFAAVEDDVVIGWCGIMPNYGGRVYELHLIIVRRGWQRKGVGTALMCAAMDAAREKGGLTMTLGADDETNETSFGNVDLFDDLPRRINEFNAGKHQSAFYMKLGFRIVGVVPNANGIGKPDIIFGKSL